MADQKNVFVIMPFSSTRSATQAEWSETYEHIFKPAIEACHYTCSRAQPGTGSLISSIIDDLRTARIVLADITDQNPNVFYELGVRHALSKRTIIVSQRGTDMPADLRGYWAVVYGRSPGEVSSFRQDVARVIREIEGDPERSDSPVSDTLERDNISVLSVIQKENTKKLTALHTELTGNIAALRGASAPYVVFASCLDLLLQTLYVDLGPDVLRDAYEIMYSLRRLQGTGNHRRLALETLPRLQKLTETVWAARERLIRGTFTEPQTITTLVWGSAPVIHARDENDMSCLNFVEALVNEPSVMCRLAGINGLEDEQVEAERVLAITHELGQRAVLVPMDDRPGWVYLQCSYKFEEADTATLKFCGSVNELLSEELLGRFAKSHGLESVVICDADLGYAIANSTKARKLPVTVYVVSGATVARQS